MLTAAATTGTNDGRRPRKNGAAPSTLRRTTTAASILVLIVSVLAFLLPSVSAFTVVHTDRHNHRRHPHRRRHRRRNHPRRCVSRMGATKAGGGGGGFGFAAAASSKKGKGKGAKKADPAAVAKVPKLSPIAKRLLKKHGNNLDAASQEYYESQMKRLSLADEGGSVDDGEDTEKEDADDATGTTADFLQPQPQPQQDGLDERHLKRVEAAWNTVALFLPADYGRTRNRVGPYVERRLRHVAAAVAACCSGTGTSTGTRDGGDADDEDHEEDSSNNQREPPSRFTLLDIGCGDGAIVPYLPDNCDYYGIDLAEEMVAVGKQRYPQYSNRFRVASLEQFLRERQSSDHENGDGFPSRYDCVLFNGSLQFFQDTRQTLFNVKQHLLNNNNSNDGGTTADNRSSSVSSKRIVLSHVNGARFVRQECYSNPTSAAVRTMPNDATLESIADLLRMRAHTKRNGLSRLFGSSRHGYDATLDGTDDEEFYLVALEGSESSS